MFDKMTQIVKKRPYPVLYMNLSIIIYIYIFIEETTKL